ncbi:DNA cytosine methyltransferase [Actinomycetospora callitridis]|uniref:DNA cytosine methyltransferase n=1 Tax=Actinomycetospora callitridis TaxID=913944 RepID=UPI0023651F7D|nr:DNA (cytosine-5-)-methyltransferase [Actinomycetospora callitridis]MDD7919686.1 DNA (cytosine-5-)-methyltransferase [Actinomycetospora callitridis]
MTDKILNQAPPPPAEDQQFSVAGLFAGIGGLERGLEASGGHAKLLCEWWKPATAVLQEHFPQAEHALDVRDLDSLPDVDVVTAGFPCTDLSQAGRTTGIAGAQSGLVSHLFRLLKNASPEWVIVENVRNMLVLDNGLAMQYLVTKFEELGYSWAYRLVDSRFTGVPQRRQRVIFVASKSNDPARILFNDDVDEMSTRRYWDDSYGFYWTEGLRGVGWAQDAVPTLKGGSSLGIPSSPAVWFPERSAGEAVVTPHITHAEELQGFPAGWTLPAERVGRGSLRWKLVGNAVTVGVAKWIGKKLTTPPAPAIPPRAELPAGARWPAAAHGAKGVKFAVSASMWPSAEEYVHLSEVLTNAPLRPLSRKATAGFLSRAERSSLRFDDRFLVALKEHELAMTL